MDRILVTGGTGTLGRHVVRRLRSAGVHVDVLTRRASGEEDGVRFVTGDLLSGSGIGSAVEEVSTIVHCAGAARGDDRAARNLVEAASHAARPNIVYISVVGADRVPVRGPIDRLMFGYFAMKRKAERVIAASGLPWTTMRATQFYDLMFKVVRALTKLPVVAVPAGVSFQPVDTDEVAARLVEFALGPPSALVADIAGPRAYAMTDLVRTYLAAAHRRRPSVTLPLPGGAARAVRAGANLPLDGVVGTRRWEDFVKQHVERPPQTLSVD